MISQPIPGASAAPNAGGLHVTRSAARAKQTKSEGRRHAGNGCGGTQRRPVLPAGIVLAEIDEAARDGRYQLVFHVDGAVPSNPPFVLAKWDGERFRCSSGAGIDFEPTHYQRRDR